MSASSKTRKGALPPSSIETFLTVPAAFRILIFFFQAEDGIRDIGVTGVQTCALPIFGEALEADPVLGQSRDREQARHRAEREEQLVVAELVDLVLVAGELKCPGGGIVPRHRSEAQVGPLEHVPERRHDVPRLQRPRRCLGKKRRVEKEVDVVYEDQARRLAGDQALEMTRRRGATEPTTDDDDVPGHVPSVAPCNSVLQAPFGALPVICVSKSPCRRSLAP